MLAVALTGCAAGGRWTVRGCRVEDDPVLVSHRAPGQHNRSGVTAVRGGTGRRHIVELKSSHVATISHPGKTVDLIVRAARATG
jgi:hypothetical protein